MIAHQGRPGGGFRTGLSAARLLAIALGLGITPFCALVIHRTAQLPPGDGTGTQWIVLTPLAMLFFLVAVPALIVGATGLRARTSAEAVRRSQRRAFKALFRFLVLALTALFLAPVLAGLLLGPLV